MEKFKVFRRGDNEIKGARFMTNNHFPVRILCSNRKGETPIVGLVDWGTVEQVITCTASGNIVTEGVGSDRYLITVVNED